MKIETTKNIKMEEIDPEIIEKSNIRKRQMQDENTKENYDKVVKNIGYTMQLVGQLQPILVRKLTAKEKQSSKNSKAEYGIISGHTRYKANEGNPSIYATVVTTSSSDDERKLAVIANFAKAEMTNEDKAEAVYKEKERLEKISEESVKSGGAKISFSYEILGQTFGVSKAYIQKLINYYKQNMGHNKGTTKINKALIARVSDFQQNYDSEVNNIKPCIDTIINETDANVALTNIDELRKTIKKITEYVNYIEENSKEIQAAKIRREKRDEAEIELEKNKNPKLNKLQTKIDALTIKMNKAKKDDTRKKIQKDIDEKQKEMNAVKLEIEKLIKVAYPIEERIENGKVNNDEPIF